MSSALELFPLPSFVPALTNIPVPRTWPGITPATSATVQALLKENHEKYHVFFNDRGFHNHTNHVVLALWSLGADEAVIRSAYKVSADYQRPAFPSPEQITRKNWTKHLGDENYYQAYCTFFTEEVKEKGIDHTLEEYIFSPSANIIQGLKAEEQPAMLNRFQAGLLHPAIHVGYGLEFAIPGVVIEGLAWTAVHHADGATKFTSADFEPASGLAARFTQAVGLENKPTKVHALSVLSRVLKDEKLQDVAIRGQITTFADVTAKHGDAIKEYVNQWSFNGPIQDKVEELSWANTLIFTGAGYADIEIGGHFNADFFHAHIVTSSLFLGTIASHLNQRSQEIFLRGYFAACLTWYVGRNRPALDVAKIFEDVKTLHPTPPGPLPTPHKDVHPSPESPQAVTANPWFAILQSSIVHPDDHLPKFQRAVAHYSEVYGDRQAGHFAHTELEGASKIDGTLFVRAAGLTIERLGWVREGRPPLESSWDRKGFVKNV